MRIGTISLSVTYWETNLFQSILAILYGFCMARTESTDVSYYQGISKGIPVSFVLGQLIRDTQLPQKQTVF